MPNSPVILGLWPVAGITTVGVTVSDAKATMIAAIEPMSIIMLGGIFGFIVLSILLPLYDVIGKF